MRAASIDDYGGQDVVKVKEVAEPRPGKGQVLVEVYSAGVNPFDWKVRDGLVRQMAELKFPATLGGDFAGVVAEVGDDVEGFIKGQAVYGQAGALSGSGSFAEFTPVAVTQLADKPKSVDFVAAASMPLAAVSAYQALADHMKLQKEQKILIHGGAGGIGYMAIQLAKHIGAYVATTVSAADIDFVKELGADEVIDYKNQDFTKIIKGYDSVFDTVGGDTTTKSYAALKPGGILVSMAARPDETLARKYDVEFISQATKVTSERLEAITALVDEGSLKPVVDKVFPLDSAAEALEYQKTGKPRGKVVIQVRT